MEIEVRLIDGFEYKASGSSFPLEVTLKSEEPIFIDENINLNRLELRNIDEEFLSFGINRTILSKSSTFVELSSSNPIKLDIDLFERGVMDEEEEVFPGKYKIEAEVTVAAKNGDKLSARPVRLEQEIIVAVVE